METKETKLENSVNLYKCRMYEQILPKEGDIVMAEITSLNDVGADCVLLEYAKCDAYLGASECSKKNSVKSIRKFLRVGKLEPLQVIRVEADKKYIDLSRKYMSSEDVDKCNERFQKSKAIHSIFNRLSDTLDIELGNLLSEVCWPLYESFENVYDCLESCTRQGTLIGELDVFKDFRPQNSGICNCKETWQHLQKELQKLLNHRFQLKEITIESLVQVNCFGINGVDAVKHSLLIGRNQGTVEYPLSITTCDSGFNIRTKGYDEKKAAVVIKNALNAIKKEIKTYNGSSFKIVKEPTIVN